MRAERAQTDGVCVRYLGTLIPVYGTRLTALLAQARRAEQQEGVQGALRGLGHELRPSRTEPEART